MRYFLAVLLLAFPAVAADQEAKVTCNETQCVVPRDDLGNLLRSNVTNAQRADRAEAALRELQSHVCAGKWM